MAERESIEELVERRLEETQESQVEGAFLAGGEHSKEQETLISFCRQYIEPRYDDDPASGNYDTVSDRAREFRDRLGDVGLRNSDEDRVLREQFRNNDEYEALPDWPVTEFLDELEAFLDEYVDASTEYQETLVEESEVQAELICWGNCRVVSFGFWPHYFGYCRHQNFPERDGIITGTFIHINPPLGSMSLEEQVRALEERLDLTRSEEIEETGRTVARLQD